MPVPPPATATFGIETEAYQVLLARAQRRTGRVPPELIARHVLSMTRGADWPVQRDAAPPWLAKQDGAVVATARRAARPRTR